MHIYSVIIMGIVKNWCSPKMPESDRLLGLESTSEYRQRWISIRVIYFTGFLVYLAFGVVSTMLWPYLKTLDPEAGKIFLTYVFATPAVVQLVCSPVFGWWNNHLPSIRLPMLFLIVTFIIGHIVYAILQDLPMHRKYMLLFSRALVGLSSVCCTIYRAYISSATTVAERTKTTSYLSLAQTVGLLTGSILQPIFSLLGEEGFRVSDLFRLNMYTVVGWFCTILGCINLILMLPCVFQDCNIAVKEAMKNRTGIVTKDLWNSVEQKNLPIGLMCVAFSLLMLVYGGFQTLLSPIALDQFGWTNEESLFYLGILMTAGALISCILFLVLDPLCKRFSEIGVLVYGAMLALFLSQLLMIPVGTKPITAYIDVNSTTGCPPTQEWCQSIPPVTKIQFTISYTLLCIAFSIGTTLSQAVFSKLLGPRPQGTWMALLTCAGSAARIVGPGSVTAYVIVGTYWTFGASTVLSGIIFLWMWVYRNRLQPSKPDSVEELKVLSSTKQ
ncbi:major facilitator superfamily domain-containing protein 8-like isoform X1 [Malaya genurostris]|uniref:major facilitator superfamily domain-containing protein 8-like isoform X1 n=1 Tax=Malaya genurostris TaxID=325434 RepID=UPI0026F3ABA8|nr:major facilitator superfamily domain-containing protein 8-like isoform X1 [Malaya genurostris]